MNDEVAPALYREHELHEFSCMKKSMYIFCDDY